MDATTCTDESTSMKVVACEDEETATRLTKHLHECLPEDLNPETFIKQNGRCVEITNKDIDIDAEIQFAMYKFHGLAPDEKE